MDFFGYIVNNPETLPMWLTLAFAVGMYPVGLLFGCSRCCRCECESGEELPETITVTLDGFTDYDKTYLASLTFTSCYGGGAVGRVEAPGQTQQGGDPTLDRGPITQVTLLEGGSGYAKKGRVEPTVVAEPQEASNGTGVTFTATLTQSLNDCKVDEWKVTKVTGKGGTGFVDEETLLFTVADGDTEQVAAVARIRTLMEEPTLTLMVESPDGGTGAVLTAVLEQEIGTTPARWRIDSVTVEDGGDGYAFTDTVKATPDNDSAVAFDAEFSVVAAHVEPTVEASILTTAGTGAALTVTLTPTTSSTNPAVTVWAVDGVAVAAAGTGYELYEQVEVLVVDGASSGSPASAYISGVDATGGILSVAVSGGGEYFKGGPITAVDVPFGGLYYRDSGEVEKVEIDYGGIYYREDDAAPPYVAEVTVEVSQLPPSDGSGAVISVTIDDDPESETFGEITGLTVEDGGDGYLAWQWTTNDCCGHYLNGVPIVLTRWTDSNAQVCGTAFHTFYKNGITKSVPVECIYTTRFCGGYEAPFAIPNYFHPYYSPQQRAMQLRVGFTGEGQIAVAELGRACGSAPSDDTSFGCGQTWFSETEIQSCSQFQWSATNPDGISIQVTPGGTYDPEWRFAGCPSGESKNCTSCCVCCQGEEDPPDEITIHWADQWPFERPYVLFDEQGQIVNTPAPDTTGSYVLQRVGCSRWAESFEHVFFDIDIAPRHCGCVNASTDPSQPPTCCEECLKKCSKNLVYMWLYSPSGGGYTMFYSWFGRGLYDGRYDGAGASATLNCETCEATPLCAPTGSIPVMAENLSIGVSPPNNKWLAGTITFQ